MPTQPHPRTHHRPLAARASSRSRSLAAAVALALALLVARPALAAVEFNYYQITASPTAVIVEWSTAREVDVAGFFIAHKPVSAPDSAYQTTVYVFASGGPNTGAVYSAPFTDLDAGVAYCFRLREQTTTGAPGEVLDRCGYGPGVTPTPAATPEFLPATPPAPGDPVATPTPKPIPVPEPLTLLLFGAGLAGIGVAVRRRGRG